MTHIDRGVRPPDFWLVLARKDNTSHSSRIGCGWRNHHGGVNLKLNPGVLLSSLEAENCYLALFGTDYRPTLGEKLGVRKPDYFFTFSVGGARMRLGSAWKNSEDYISILLNPGVHITYAATQGDDIWLNLWPAKDSNDRTQHMPAGTNTAGPDAGDDDIPF